MLDAIQQPLSSLVTAVYTLLIIDNINTINLIFDRSLTFGALFGRGSVYLRPWTAGAQIFEFLQRQNRFSLVEPFVIGVEGGY